MVVNLKFGYVAASAVFLIGTFASAQDTPSLGDLARQQRAKKDQSKAAPSKDAKSTKVITNEELPEHPPAAAAGPTARNMNQANSMPSGPDAGNLPAEQWKSQIEGAKNQIASMQKQIDDLNSSIQFAPGNCVENCVQWNQHQQEKQQQVERMRAVLEQQKTRLEQMQESARSQGYGSSVWDP
jgi:hypothetical protein